jgi:ubiquinone/menaquinone biosynthesis C-methylase UbiE
MFFLSLHRPIRKEIKFCIYWELIFAMFSCKVARYKSQIFSNLKEKKANKILEIGIGTGPNLSYYGSNPDVQVVGIDPNPEMEKYARSSAASAGLPLSNFEFIHAVCNISKSHWFLSYMNQL